MESKYPYFIYPDVMALRSGNLSPEEKKRVSRRVAALTGDTAALRIMLGIDPREFAAFYPDMATTTPSTNETIDTFLEKFVPATDNGDPDIPHLDSPLASPGKYRKGYESSVERGTEHPEDGKTLSATGNQPEINKPAEYEPKKDSEAASAGKAIIENATRKPGTNKKGSSRERMKLADSLIRQRKYQEALEIITDLNLNNPEKSVYFADQIRFLRKLISLNANKSEKI